MSLKINIPDTDLHIEMPDEAVDRVESLIHSCGDHRIMMEWGLIRKHFIDIHMQPESPELAGDFESTHSSEY